MKEKKKKIKRKLGLLQKILFGVLGVVILAVLIWFIYYMVHYYLYDDYKQYLSGYETENGTEFTALKDSSKDVEGMELAAENDILKLYASTDSGDVAVYDKRSGAITYSNPVNADDDPIANNTNKNYLKSQFVINYYNAAKAMGTYDSYSMAVARGQLQAQSIDNGIRFIYNLGDFSTNTTGIVPLYMSQDKLDEICALLDDTAATNMRRYYSTADSATGMLVLNGVAQKNIKTIKKITGYLETAGFTEADYEEQMELAGVEVALPLSFTIALEYRLADDGIEVSVPASMIEENGGGSLYRNARLLKMSRLDTLTYRHDNNIAWNSDFILHGIHRARSSPRINLSYNLRLCPQCLYISILIGLYSHRCMKLIEFTALLKSSVNILRKCCHIKLTSSVCYNRFLSSKTDR